MWSKIKEKSLGFAQNRNALRNLGILLSLILPISLLYVFYTDSFMFTFGAGRAMYIVFLWLVILEFALFWNQISSTPRKRFGSLRIFALAACMVIPTVFVLAAFYTNLNQLIVELGKFLGVPSGGRFGDVWITKYWPIDFENLVLAAFFSASVLLMYGKAGIRKLSVGWLFLWAATIFFLIDTFYPYGRLGLLQIFVPFTVESSASVLRLMGYHAITNAVSDPFYGPGTLFAVVQNKSIFAVLVYWPSAGVNSMFIYTLTILLFIQSAALSIKQKVIIFLVGAVGTFMANVLRIVTISLLGLRVGMAAAVHFHDYYGEFFFISWILIYLTVILLGPRIVEKLRRNMKKDRLLAEGESSQSSQPSIGNVPENGRQERHRKNTSQEEAADSLKSGNIHISPLNPLSITIFPVYTSLLCPASLNDSCEFCRSLVHQQHYPVHDFEKSENMWLVFVESLFGFQS